MQKIIYITKDIIQHYNSPNVDYVTLEQLSK